MARRAWGCALTAALAVRISKSWGGCVGVQVWVDVCGRVIHTHTHSLSLSLSYNLTHLFQELVAGKIDASHAWERVNNIAKVPPCFPLWAQFLSYPLSGFSCALTFFGGGLLEAGIATLCAVMVGVLVLVGMRVNTLNRVMEFVCAFFVGFLTRVLTGADPTHGCFVTIALSALVRVCGVCVCVCVCVCVFVYERCG